MTDRETYVATMLRHVRLHPRSAEKRFVKDLARDPDRDLSCKQERRLGALWYACHDSNAEAYESRLGRLTYIAKGFQHGGVVFRGICNGQIVPLEAVEFYFCRAAKIQEVPLAELGTAPARSQEERQNKRHCIHEH